MFSLELDDCYLLIADEGVGELLEKARKLASSSKERSFLDTIEQKYEIYGDFAELTDKQMQFLVAIAGYDSAYTAMKKAKKKQAKAFFLFQMRIDYSGVIDFGQN